MVDQKAYNYLKRYKGRYDLTSLKKKLIDSGYSKKDVDEAANALSNSGASNTTTPGKTTSKLAPVPPTMQSKQPVAAQQTIQQKPQTANMMKKQPVAQQQTQQLPPKKPKKTWLWILLIVLLLAVGGLIAAYLLGYINVELPF